MQKFKLVIFISITLIILVLYSLEKNGIDQVVFPEKNWKISAPQIHKIDPLILTQMDEYIKKKAKNITSLLVLRNGHIIFEQYYEGNKKSLRELNSITKSIIALLIGITIEENYIPGLKEPITKYFADIINDKNYSLINNLTIYDLLSMNGGFHYSLDGISSIDELESFFNNTQTTRSDTVQYNSTYSHLLAIILTRATGMSVEKYALKKLFNPLNITDYTWEKDLTGYNFGGYGLWLSSRDLAKIGYLVLNWGKWKERVIVSEEWINQSISPVNHNMIKYLGDFQEEQFGLNWWIDKEMEIIYSYGLGGQYLMIIPAFNMVVVLTSVGEAMDLKGKDIVNKFIISAIL